MVSVRCRFATTWDEPCSVRKLSDTWSPEVHRLLEVAEAANPPDNIDEGLGNDLVVHLPNGWAVGFWYQGGSLEGIDHFVEPSGEVVDFYSWPDDRAGRDLLKVWCRRGHLEWLRDEVAWHPEGTATSNLA